MSRHLAPTFWIAPQTACQTRRLRAPRSCAAALKRQAGALLFALWIIGAPAPDAVAATPGEAGRFIDALGHQVLGLLASYRENQAPRYRAELKQIIRDNFDLEWGTRFVMGRHWRDATPQQQSELLTIIPEYAAEIAARAFFTLKANDVDSFRVLSSQAIDDRDSFVTTEVRVTGSPLTVSWRVRDEGRRLRIIDATIQGVSVALTLRQTLDSVIARDGIDGLITDVRGKLAQLRGGPG